jgi:pimeloyl-ACP methyl ester carboxylesterase
VLDVINELSLSNIVLAGHSMGVRMILETWQQAIAAGKPTVKGLCFIDGSHYKFRKSLFAFDHGDPRSKTLTNEQKATGMAYAFKRMFSDNTPADFQEATLAHVRSMDMQYNEAMRKSFITYDYERMDDVLTAVGEAGNPVLSFQATNVDEQNQRRRLEPGERSQWMDFLQEKVPQIQQVVVDDAMHFPHVDQPAIVAERIRDFVESM